MPWNPDRYHQFQRERFAPFEDLLRLIRVREGMEVVDLGCGTGELTRRLADALPESQVLGIDSSPEMLVRAEEHTGSNVRFALGDIETVDGRWDLVFSHAAIQWVPNHPTLVPRLLSLVQPRGQIAVQLPSNHDHISHQLIRKTAGEEPFRAALSGWSRESPVLPIDDYAEILYGAGAGSITVLEKVYPHVLESADAVADWTSGTALVPYMERLPEELREPFMERYRELLRQVWPEGPVFYGFRRILFAADR